MDRSDEGERQLRRILELTEKERKHPQLSGFLKLVGLMILRPLRDRVGLILASTIVLLMLWGHDGELPLVHLIWSGWQPAAANPGARPEIIPGLPWDQEWLSFAAGVLLVVLIPCALIKLVYRESLRSYGLGLPQGSRLRLSVFSAVFLFAVSLPAFLVATGDEGMKATYPIYRGTLDGWDFATYELGYLLFFVAIEFVFRGYLLLGLFSVRDREALPEATGERGPLLFGYYAILISMLSYTAWHLGKPTPELWGTLVWGPVAGAIVLLTRSIWPVVAVHWALNVVLDLLLTR